jgi:exopolysaccharide production protein ExoQ
MLSLGIVGAATLAWVILRAIAEGAELGRRRPEEGWLWLNVLVGMFLFMNLTESIILSQNDFFWILFVCYAAMFSLRRAEAGR